MLYRSSIGFLLIISMLVFLQWLSNHNQENSDAEFERHTTRPAKLITVIERNYPTAIIAGVKKGGTRALLEFLRLNSQIQAPAPEIHFFDKNYFRGFDWYRSQMPLASPDKIIIEKSPAYFHNKDVPARIKQFNPNMKVILVLRDPVIRAISDYTQTLSKRKYKILHPSFEKMALNWSNINAANETAAVNTRWTAIKIGLYHKHLKKWLLHFPPEQILIVDGEQLITSPAIEVNKVEKFLGLKPVVKPEYFAVDPHKHFPCVRAKGELHCLGKTKGRKHPQVQSEVLQKLAEFYHPHNEELFKMINRKFYWSPERNVSLIH